MKQNSVAAGRASPSSRQSRMVVPEREAPGKTAATSWPKPDGDGHRPGHLVIERLAAQPGFDEDKADAADQQGPGNRRELLGQFEALLLQDEPGAARQRAGEHDLQGVVLRRLLAPAEQELVEALVKQRDDRQHRPGLDDDVEEVALVDVQPALGNEQVAGGRNRQELGDAFHNPEQNNSNPVWHRVVRRQNPAKDKPQMRQRAAAGAFASPW